MFSYERLYPLSFEPIFKTIGSTDKFIRIYKRFLFSAENRLKIRNFRTVAPIVSKQIFNERKRNFTFGKLCFRRLMAQMSLSQRCECENPRENRHLFNVIPPIKQVAHYGYQGAKSTRLSIQPMLNCPSQDGALRVTFESSRCASSTINIALWLRPCVQIDYLFPS